MDWWVCMCMNENQKDPLILFLIFDSYLSDYPSMQKNDSNTVETPKLALKCVEYLAGCRAQ